MAFEAGAFETAARIFERVEIQHPIIADHAARWHAASLLKADHPAEAAALAIARASTDPRGLLAGEFARIEAEARTALDEHRAARDAWTRAAKRERDHEARAELLANIARSHEGEKNGPAARDAWLEVWMDLPETPSAEAATKALERLDKGAQAKRKNPANLRTRCDALTQTRRNESALATCTLARDSTGNASERRRLERRRADLLFRLRRYKEAHLAYAGLSGRDARFRAARSLARSSRVTESIAEFEALGAGKDELAARARFLAGTLWDDRDVTRARELYASVAKDAPLASQRTEANWRLGWTAYQAGRYDEAETRLDGVARGASDPIDALRGRYWSARAALRAGDPNGLERLADIAREFPFTYYGWRAAGFGPSAPTSQADAMTDQTRSAGSKLPERTLERARILVEADLAEDAVRELLSVRRRARTQADRVLLANLLQDAGDPHEAQRLILGVHLLDLARGPRPGDAELWWAAYPNAYAEYIDVAVAQREVDASVVYAVMREESGYRPKVLSVSGAIGLAQIMPETGRRLALQLGSNDFDPDELFVPKRNLELASHYLESLLSRFDGRTSAAVASYNAGPTAVARWLDARGELPDDEWVESIPYDQTRAYVKRVLRSRYAYDVLY
jgi:soluble lytic murein transglycosylase